MVQLRDLFGETSNWSRTVEEFHADALSTVGAFLQPMHSMTWFILLLAAVGVINNLLINYLQKRRSIAMYKSVGLSNRQNMKMTLIEGFSSGLVGAAIAGFRFLHGNQTDILVSWPKNLNSARIKRQYIPGRWRYGDSCHVAWFGCPDF